MIRGRFHFGRSCLIAAAVLAVALPCAAWAQSATPKTSSGAGTKAPTSAGGGATTKPKAASTGAKAKAPAASGQQRPIPEAARQARELEDRGAYGRAALDQRQLRKRMKLDGDLELALAINDGRSGAIDSALARLYGPTLTAAAVDSMPLQRRREYPYGREAAWINCSFDGWHWYVWRARAELLAHQGRWAEAAEAARGAVAARSLSGKDWLILAVCAARAGQDQESHLAAERAVELDPMLPEAYYLAGLWDWKQGRRVAASTRFRQAVALDSTYSPAALALIRSRIPGAAPDTFPAALLTGVRRIALMTSPLGPKPEEFHEMDVSATLLTSPDSAVVDSLVPGVKPIQLVISVLVDESGRSVLNEVPWFPPGQFDFRKVTRILRGIPGWAFHPARRLGEPARVWVNVDFYLNP